jgi:hypothetical protein
MQNIPALKLSYSHLLLQELRHRGSATVNELAASSDVERLFKSEAAHTDPEGRARTCLRYAALVGLATEEAGRFSLTDSGRTYVSAIRDADACGSCPRHSSSCFVPPMTRHIRIF